VLAEVFQPTGNVAEHAEEHVHRGGLRVTAGLPPRECVLPQAKQARELGLGEMKALPQRTNLLRGEEAVLLSVELQGAFAEPPRIIGAMFESRRFLRDGPPLTI
jgi:hypothetical protein